MSIMRMRHSYLSSIENEKLDDEQYRRRPTNLANEFNNKKKFILYN